MYIRYFLCVIVSYFKEEILCLFMLKLFKGVERSKKTMSMR